MGLLEGKVAIVTGGGSGIGRGIARAFAEQGCSLVLAARNVQRLEETAAELAETGVDVLIVPTDVTDEDQVVALFAEAVAHFGRLDVLVNNAGAFDGGPIDDLTAEAFLHVMKVNVVGPFLCTREAFKIMKPAGGGRVINIGSISAQRSRMNTAPYTTSKFAIWGLTQSAALEGREYGIAVSCIHPGNVAVDRRVATGDVDREPMMAPDQIGRTAALMASFDPQVNMLEAIVLPLTQEYLGRG